MDFTGKYDSGSESGDEEITEEELAETYRLLPTQWKEAWLIVVKQKKTISVLLVEKEKSGSTITNLE